MTALYIRSSDAERILELETQLATLQQQEKLSAVDRSVSKQMEEIAYGQQALSEERSREAIRQSEIAQAATLRSEAERRNALKAQASAEEFALEAMESYRLAERQRLEADEQRLKAEHAKMVTDTLNYISLGRTLGSQAYALYNAGDKELGNMLAYASYLFTKDYGGDLFTPTVFQALTQSAGASRDYAGHLGSISRIAFFPTGDSLLTASTYGELFLHTMTGGLGTLAGGGRSGTIVSLPLLSNKDYCFRDVLVTRNGRGYAVSHTGHLVVINRDKVSVVPLEGIARPFSIQPFKDARQLLIIGVNSLALFDIATNRVVNTRQLSFNVTCTGRIDDKPLLFDDRGTMHLVNTLDDMTNERVPVAGRVSAFACSQDKHLTAYGMVDGTIWLTDGFGTTQRLVGHLSQVTKLMFFDEQTSKAGIMNAADASAPLNSDRLYSSSYDGKLLFWPGITNPLQASIQIKPITLLQANDWLTDFTFDSNMDCIWTGEANGTMTESLISLPLLSQRIRQSLRRDFTQEEWNYYVGKGIPYKQLRNDK